VVIVLGPVFLARHDLHTFAAQALPAAGLAVLFARVPALVIR